MKNWWVRPGVRGFAALFLPVLVPAVVTLFVFALPGGPAEIICPVVTCGVEQNRELAEYYNIHNGPVYFFTSFVGDVLQGNLGTSWRVQQGLPISEMLSESLPNSMLLLVISMGFISIASICGGLQVFSQKWDPVLVTLGIVPVVVLSLLTAAVIELQFGSSSVESFSAWMELIVASNSATEFFDNFKEGIPYWSRILLAACTLGLADGVFSGAIIGVREVFTSENKERYVGIAVLRGEKVLSNTLPNLAGALSGQYRARIVNLLSGVVIVEVIVGVNGVGSLLWMGTLKQDFGVVLAAATCFAFLSSLLLLLQAVVEIIAALHIRRAPQVLSQGAT